MNARIRKQALKYYQESRKQGAPALGAWTYAVRKAQVNAHWDRKESAGLVRMTIEPDELCSYDDLAGDMFNPKANPDINPSLIAKQEKEFKDRIDRDGVWGIVTEYFDGEAWQQADSCWGFVGDDWKDSGYDIDAKEAALDALTSVKHCKACGRPMTLHNLNH